MPNIQVISLNDSLRMDVSQILATSLLDCSCAPKIVAPSNLRDFENLEGSIVVVDDALLKSDIPMVREWCANAFALIPFSEFEMWNIQESISFLKRVLSRKAYVNPDVVWL